MCHSGANRLQKWTQTPRTTTETASTFYSVYIRQQSVIRRRGRGRGSVRENWDLTGATGMKWVRLRREENGVRKVARRRTLGEVEYD